MSRRSIHAKAKLPFNELLQQHAANDTPFTKCGLRDELYYYPELKAFNSQTLLCYVHGQTATYEKRGWVEQIDTLGKRRGLYRVTPAYVEQMSETASNSDGQDKCSIASLDAQLQCESEKLREDITNSEFRLQTFREIASKYPDAHDAIVSLFEEEKARAKASGEKLKAYAEVRQRLAQVGGEA